MSQQGRRKEAQRTTGDKHMSKPYLLYRFNHVSRQLQYHHLGISLTRAGLGDKNNWTVTKPWCFICRLPSALRIIRSLRLVSPPSSQVLQETLLSRSYFLYSMSFHLKSLFLGLQSCGNSPSTNKSWQANTLEHRNSGATSLRETRRRPHYLSNCY